MPLFKEFENILYFHNLVLPHLIIWNILFLTVFLNQSNNSNYYREVELFNLLWEAFKWKKTNYVLVLFSIRKIDSSQLIFFKV